MTALYVTALYVLNTLDGKPAAATGFDTKKAAKAERNRLIGAGTVCVVSRGPDHPNGPTSPDPLCRNTEKTSHKRRKRVFSEVF